MSLARGQVAEPVVSSSQAHYLPNEKVINMPWLRPRGQYGFNFSGISLHILPREMPFQLFKMACSIALSQSGENRLNPLRVEGIKH